MFARMSALIICLSLLMTFCSPAIRPQPNPLSTPNPDSGTLPAASPTTTRFPIATATQSQNTGTLKGRVTVGPLLPGPVRVGVTPPPIPPEVFTTRIIQILAADGTTLVTNVRLSPDGTYSVTLPPGDYVVNLARNGMDRARDLPKKVLIEPGKTYQLDIDIDTGIR